MMKTQQRTFRWITLLRCFFILILVFVLESLVKTGTSPWLLSLAAIAGTTAGSRLAFSQLRAGGFLLLLLALLCSYQILFAALGYLFPGQGSDIFGVFSLLQHTNLCYLAAIVAALSSWYFWKYQTAATIELVLVSAAAISLLSGHRNFHFEAPLVMNDLAWRLHLSQLQMLIISGAALLVVALVYIYLSTLPGRPVAQPSAPSARSYRTTHGSLMRLVAILCSGLALYFICQRIYGYYNLEALTRTANGVGQERREGLTPLGFHSALGATNQPAALVRLEGDYPENPFSPMLYLRESALSTFNGRELVIAESQYDGDAPAVTPEGTYKGSEDTDLKERTPVVQSMYLLTDHKNSFALDYPVSLVRLKNPDPSRFKATYRAYSIAPGYPKNSFLSESVGDPRWSRETLGHYLAPHPDPRYHELALRITAGVDNPVEKMDAITVFLSRNATYTLTPNHEVQKDEDPVAPFLFGDLRGYCVHFAHAMVYMARAVGIPARIGTGYLTDLSQSKDGHILLRMSDRHAWAEVYINSHGWVPFDVRPDKVESHAESPVDMRILEELMDLLGPGEELLPESLTAGEPRIDEPPAFYVPGIRDISLAVAAVFLLLIILKAWLRMGWLLPGGPAFKLKRSCIAVASSLHDLGYRRRSAETRGEFLRRMQIELGIGVPGIYAPLNLLKYASSSSARLSADDISRVRSEDFLALRSLPLLKRIGAFFNPASILAFLAGGGW